MARSYFTSATLDLAFDFNVIKIILNKGLQLGYIFIVEGFSMPIEDIIIGLETAEKENDIFPVTVGIEGTYFGISFVNFNGRLSIMFVRLNDAWSRIDFDGEEEIDIQRYALTLLNLVSDYKVLKVNIQKD